MKYIPNSFQIANAVVDDFLCLMSGNAWKCYGVIVRKTTGWQKEMDYISVSQFKTLTGIKKDETVTDALKELEELNLIASVKQRGKVTGYRLNMPKLPPENGGTTTPEKGGSTKHTIKPTNTKYSISASAAADAPLPSDHSENGGSAATVKAKPTRNETELALLADYGITGQEAEDFLQIRKAKRQPLTETAMKLLAADAEKCEMTARDAVLYAIGNGWGSFRAEWLQNKTFGRSGNRGGLTHNQTADVMDGKNYGNAPTTDF